MSAGLVLLQPHQTAIDAPAARLPARLTPAGGLHVRVVDDPGGGDVNDDHEAGDYASETDPVRMHVDAEYPDEKGEPERERVRHQPEKHSRHAFFPLALGRLRHHHVRSVGTRSP